MKAVKGILVGAAIIGLAVATGGISLAPTIAASGGIATAGILGTGLALSTTALGSIALGIGASMAISGITSELKGSPKVPQTQADRLNLVTDPKAFRKSVRGSTSFPLDVRYQEWNGPAQDVCDLVIAHAGHRCHSLDEIWINDELAWVDGTDAGTGKYAGYLFVNFFNEGGPTSGMNLEQGKWTQASSRLTGCSWTHVRLKTSGISKGATSPFVNGVPNRWTFIGKGAPAYDPRRDSTVIGGDGTFRANDQATWRYLADDGNQVGENIPLQILGELLGWRITNPTTGEKKLSVGVGLPRKRLHLESFATAANLAEEMVVKQSGGYEPRFYGAITSSEGEPPATMLDALCAACNGKLVEIGGKIGLEIAHNDLASAATDPGLNDDDVLSAFVWNPDPSLDQCPNVVSGSYTDPTPASLYQQIPYAEARLASVDGLDRVFNLDLTACESPSHASRIASQVLERKQYDRTFTATFDIRAWSWPVGSVVPFTFAALSFDRKLFRVTAQEIGQDGKCNMTLRVEDPAIYAWDGGDGAPVTAASPNVYDSRNSGIIRAIGDAATTAAWTGVVDDDPTGRPRPDDGATNTRNPAAPMGPTATVQDLLDARTLAGDTATALDLTAGQVSAIKEANLTSDAADRQRDRDFGRIGEALGRLLIEADRSRIVMRDAGITVDPTTGVVRLFALEEARDHLNDLEVTLDAQEARIALRATRTYVDEQIALAVIDPTQAAGLEQLIARISDAEISVDAIRGQVALKASSTELTTLGIRVSDVEQVMTAVGDVTSLRTTIRRARYSADLAGRNALAGILSGDIADRARLVALAEVQQQITAAINARGEAEAQSRITLAVQTANLGAAILSESIVRSSAISAEALLRQALEAAIADPVTGLLALGGKISSESSIRVTERDIQAGVNTAITARFNNAGGPGKTAEAALAENKQATADEASARASDISGIGARLNNVGMPNRSIEAAINDAASAGVSAAGAVATDLNTVRARINDVGGQTIEAAVNVLREAVATLDGKTTARLEQVAIVGGVVAGIRAIVQRENGTTTGNLALIAPEIGFWLQRASDGLLIQAMGLELRDGVPLTRFYGEIDAYNIGRNAAMIPGSAAASARIYGDHADTVGDILLGDTMPTSLTTTIYMPTPGLIEVDAVAKLISDNGVGGSVAWAMALDVNESILSESYVLDNVQQGAVPMAGTFYAETAGYYVARLRFQGTARMSVSNRTIRVKGYPNTVAS